jgi:hypothetical protein
VVFICLIFFFYATEELGMGSWISTYSIKAGVADVEGSAFYSLLFWLPNCFGRLVWMYIPGKVERRLGISLKAVLFTVVITVIFQYFEWFYLVCIFAPITSGLLIAGVYGFGIALPVDNGFAPCSQVNANFILANALGEGLLIMPLGFSMNLYGFEFLMLDICFFAFLSYWVYSEAVKSMRADLAKT